MKIQAALVLGFAALIVLGGLGAEARPRIRRYHFKAEYIYWSPDCVETVLIGINGQYPGPTIRATAGDTVIVDLENGIATEGLVIHWHGIRQIGTPFYDGAAYVSQCPVNSGETFRYKFVVDRAGTYFYHGHFGLQRSAGFYGSLVVDEQPGTVLPFKYDAEFTIILNDWWHRSVYDQETGLGDLSFKFVGEPQSLLIEGKGSYNCSLIPKGGVAGSGDVKSCNASNSQCQPHVLSVQPGKTYRLRIASTASLSSLNFVMENHALTIVEVDGHYVTPVQVKNLDLYSGFAYSVLFTANQDRSKNYWIGVNVRGRKPSTPTALGILNYSPNPSTKLPTTPTPTSPAWDDFAYSVSQQKLIYPRSGYEVSVPKNYSVRLQLLSTQNRVNGHTKWAINNISYVPSPTPLLASLKYKLAYDTTPPPKSFPQDYDIMDVPVNANATTASGVYIFKYGDVVDILLQNANTLVKNNSEIHPWHLHGHDFWVLGYGDGKFNDATDYNKLNFKNPVMRNTVGIFPYGWTYIRYLANNPGAWPFHCHIESHFHMGMGVMFAEGIDRLPRLPTQTLGCGLTKSLIRH